VVLRPPTTIVCARLTPAELATLDAMAGSRTEALRSLVGVAGSTPVFDSDESLPVLWYRLISEVEHHHRLYHRVHAEPGEIDPVIAAVHREDYPQAKAAWDRVQAIWEPSAMVWPP